MIKITKKQLHEVVMNYLIKESNSSLESIFSNDVQVGDRKFSGKTSSNMKVLGIDNPLAPSGPFQRERVYTYPAARLGMFEYAKLVVTIPGLESDHRSHNYKMLKAIEKSLSEQLSYCIIEFKEQYYRWLDSMGMTEPSSDFISGLDKWKKGIKKIHVIHEDFYDNYMLGGSGKGTPGLYNSVQGTLYLRYPDFADRNDPDSHLAFHELLHGKDWAQSDGTGLVGSAKEFGSRFVKATGGDVDTMLEPINGSLKKLFPGEHEFFLKLYDAPPGSIVLDGTEINMNVANSTSCADAGKNGPDVFFGKYLLKIIDAITLKGSRDKQKVAGKRLSRGDKARVGYRAGGGMFSPLQGATTAAAAIYLLPDYWNSRNFNSKELRILKNTEPLANISYWGWLGAINGMKQVPVAHNKIDFRTFRDAYAHVDDDQKLKSTMKELRASGCGFDDGIAYAIGKRLYTLQLDHIEIAINHFNNIITLARELEMKRDPGNSAQYSNLSDNPSAIKELIMKILDDEIRPGYVTTKQKEIEVDDLTVPVYEPVVHIKGKTMAAKDSDDYFWTIIYKNGKKYKRKTKKEITGYRQKGSGEFKTVDKDIDPKSLYGKYVKKLKNKDAMSLLVWMKPTDKSLDYLVQSYMNPMNKK